MNLYTFASHALPADALCGIDASEGTSVDRIARAIEASGYGSAAAHRTAILRALGEHLRAQYTDARKALQWLASFDRRLAVWGACACARETLRFIPAGEEIPLRAIEAAEGWLAGQATLDAVQRAQVEAGRAWSGRSSASAYSASASAYAAAAYAAAADVAAYSASATYAAYAAAYSASASAYSASAYAYSAYAAATKPVGPGWLAAHAAELARLVGVIADALPGIPPEPIQ